MCNLKILITMVKKQIVTMEMMNTKIQTLFPNKEIKHYSLVPFSHVEFTIEDEKIEEDFCVLFQFKGSKLTYVYNLVSTVLYTNLQDLKHNLMDLGESKKYGNKTYKVINAKGQYGVEIKDDPKITNYEDAWKIWEKHKREYLMEYKGSFYAPFVKGMVCGEEGYIVALKNAGTDKRDILFIRADNGEIFSYHYLSKFYHYFYLENTKPKKTVDLPIPPKKN